MGSAQQGDGSGLLVGPDQLGGDLDGRVHRRDELLAVRCRMDAMTRGGGPRFEPADRLPRGRQPGMHIAPIGEPLGGFCPQRMAKAHAGRAHLSEDAGAYRRGEPVGGRPRCGPQRRGEYPQGRPATGHGRRPEQPPGVCVELLQRVVEHVADHPAAVRGVQQLTYEQWVASGAGRERDGVDRPARLSSRQLVHGVGVQAFETHDPADTSQRIEFGHVRLAVAAGRDERHRRVAERSRQLLEHPDRRRVRPVEVVEDHDRWRRRAQRSGQRVEMLPPPVGGRDRRIVGRIDAERPVHPAPQLHRLADRRVGFAVQHPHPGRPGAVRRLVGQPGLANSRLANHQHDVRAAATRRVHRRLQRRQLALAPDDTIVARRDRRGHRLQLPVASETGAAYRPDVQRSIEAPELPFAEVGHLEPGRQVVAHEYGRRLRHQHLPAPRRGHDPGGAIGPRPEVVVGGRGGRRRVQADAAAQRHPAGEPTLTLDGRADGGDRVGEHRHETVPGVFDNFAPGRGDRRLDDPVVLGEFGTHRVRLAFPARRGALDVGEQEGDRPSRTNRHRGDDRPPAWSAAAEYSARPDQLNRRSTSPRSGSDRR